MREQFKDQERCKKCGGKCCLIYIDSFDGGTKANEVYFEEWIKQLDEAFASTGADKIAPLFDPLDVHKNGNESLREALRAKGINPDNCKYCGKDGCILPWDLRPLCCREYRCAEWQREDSKKSS